MNKNLLLTALFAMLWINSWSQIEFEEGYFIDESGQTVNCLIRNPDWKNNPTEFRYKNKEGDPVQTAGISTVAEFGIPGTLKYVRAQVQIEKSKDVAGEISYKREPVFQEEIVFLKVLVEGVVTLFSYENKNLNRYFYKTVDTVPVPLVYKKYMTEVGIATNEDYKQHLLNAFQGYGVSINEIRNLTYTSNDLEHFFAGLNKSNGFDFKDFQYKKKSVINLSLRPGINFSSLKERSDKSSFYNTDFDPEQNLRVGLEAEWILPFHKHKLGILFEPVYQYYNQRHPASLERYSAEVNYNSFELTGGIRYYFYINNTSKIFVNALVVPEIDNNSTIKVYRFEEHLQEQVNIRSEINMAAGIGFTYRKKYAVELRYYTPRELLYLYSRWTARYSNFSVTFGYSLF